LKKSYNAAFFILSWFFIAFYLRKSRPSIVGVTNNFKIILYLDFIFIFYFFLSLFSLYIWTEIIFARNCEKENIYGHIL